MGRKINGEQRYLGGVRHFPRICTNLIGGIFKVLMEIEVVVSNVALLGSILFDFSEKIIACEVQKLKKDSSLRWNC